MHFVEDVAITADEAGLWVAEGGHLSDDLILVRAGAASSTIGVVLHLLHVPSGRPLVLLCQPLGVAPQFFASAGRVAVSLVGDVDHPMALAAREIVPRLGEASLHYKLMVRVKEETVRDVAEKWERTLDSNPGSLKVTDYCDEACAFCSSPKSGYVGRLSMPAPELVHERIERWAKEGHRVLDVVGREPTLNPHLPEFFARAKSLGFRGIRMNSNGVRLADPALADEYVRAGLNEVCISLHATNAEDSDRITARADGFAAKLQAIRNMLRHPITVVVNFVVLAENFQLLRDFVRFIEDTFRDGRLPRIAFSFVGPVGDADGRPELMPRYRDVEPYLREALDLSRPSAGLEISVHEEYGVPLCILEARHLEQAAPLKARARRGRRYVGACDGCARRPRCNGVWEAYLDRFGEAEIRSMER
jgi:MoaA/NifB/PqqE/SkfB family radical SAM enzyme